MRLVPTVRTPLTSAEAVAALHVACLRVAGSITANGLAMVVSQSALETGRWRSLYCWNWGNEKSGPSWAGDYYMIRCNEVLEDGKLHWFDPPHPQTWFRAFPTAADGAESHVRFLTQHEPTAWHAALAGDPTAYAHALKLAHYYTASEALYTRGVVSLFREFLPIAAASVATPPALPTPPAAPVVPSSVRSPVSDADLERRIRQTPRSSALPDWRDDAMADRDADELEGDLPSDPDPAA